MRFRRPEPAERPHTECVGDLAARPAEGGSLLPEQVLDRDKPRQSGGEVLADLLKRLELTRGEPSGREIESVALGRNRLRRARG